MRTAYIRFCHRVMEEKKGRIVLRPQKTYEALTSKPEQQPLLLYF